MTSPSGSGSLPQAGSKGEALEPATGIVAGRVAGRRFLALDSLRGLAALFVVFFHVQGALDRAPQPWMPSAARTLFRSGHFGVDVFFVLSGFVIAYSVRDGSWTMRFFGRFALKRSFRLDPPYWAAIAFEIGLILLGLAFVPSLATPVPSPGQILSHLFYLQDVLGYGDIMANFWTLCYEFQFYLTLIGILVLGTTIQRRIGRRAAVNTIVVIFGILFVTSVAVHQGRLPNVHRGIALDRWFEFFTGALAWWVVARVIRLPVLLAAWVMAAVLATRPETPIEMSIVTMVSTVCMLSATRPGFDRLFRWRPLQFLGAISYSLYLYHPSVGWRVVSLAQRLAGPSLPAAIGVCTWLAAVAAALVVAVIGWHFVERPSQAWASRVKLPRKEPTEVAAPLPAALTIPVA